MCLWRVGDSDSDLFAGCLSPFLTGDIIEVDGCELGGATKLSCVRERLASTELGPLVLLTAALALAC